MTASTRRQVHQRLVLLVGLFVVCCCFAVEVRSLVAAEAVGDLTAVVLQLGTLAAFLVLAGFVVAVALRAPSVAARVTGRVLPPAVAVAAAIFAGQSYADVSVALHALTTTSDGGGTVLALGPDGRDVRLTGDITEGAAARLGELLKTNPKVERIHLTSDGGLADEGENLRKVIAAHGLTTFVPDYCVSACTLAFLGGRARIVMTGARLGFHAPYEEGLFDQTFAGDSSAERAIYIAAGVAPEFVDAALKVAPSDIWTPDEARLISAHIATAVVGRDRMPDSNLDGDVSVAGARAAVLRNFPLAKVIGDRAPQAVDVLADWYLDAYRHDRTEGQIVDGLTHILDGAASIAIAGADDDTLIGFARFVDTAMAAADTDEACAAIGANASLVEAQDVLDQDDDGADKIAVALLARALRTRRTSPLAADAGPWPEASTVALAASRRPCAQMRAYYARALALPRHDGAVMIRALLTHPAQTAPLSRIVLNAVH